MTVLSFTSSKFELSEGAEDIGDVFSALASDLPKIGVTSVKNEPDHVHGDKGDVSMTVTFLFISGREFWQVVMCAGPNQADNDALRSQVISLIGNLKFL